MLRVRRSMALPGLLASLVTLTGATLGQRTLQAREPSAAAGADSALLKTYKWRSVGPDRGGRSIAVSGVKGRPKEAYFGAVGGGLWKTTDGGETWAPVTDGQVHSASVGAVAVSESNPDIVVIGMGESCIRGNIMAGDGVYKSADGGKTWTHLGFEKSENISKIRIHPTNPDIIFVAAFGKHSAPNAERGVFKSADGGKSWKRVLFRNDSTAAIDLTIDRTNPDVMYAALWEAYRTEFTMSSGGTGSGLFKSTDGGETWKEITRNPGMPAGLIGRIGVTVSPVNANRVFALVENAKGGLFKSDDAGATWTLMTDNRNVRQRAFYYTHVIADSKNADVVYMLNTSAFRSDDAGKTMTSVGNGTHGDFHDLWVDPDNAQHLVIGNDGGGSVSATGGKAWTEQDFPTEQFYRIATTAHIPYHLCGSQQDNTTMCVPFNWNMPGAGRGRAIEGLPAGRAQQVWYQAGGGEPGYMAPDPKDPDLYFAGTNNGGFLNKFNRRTGQSTEVNPYPWMYSGEPSKEIRERWQWTYPIIFSPADPHILYASSQRLWRTPDGGKTWTAISGDLTRHDPKTMGHSGGPITGDMNGPEVYAVIFAVGPGKKNVNVIWTGSDDGLVHVTKDGGKTWANVTAAMPKFTEWATVSLIEPSPFDAATAYVVIDAHRLDDMKPYLFKTTDYGKTWKSLSSTMKPDVYLHAVREDPSKRGMLYVGTERGIVFSRDDGTTWEPLKANFPTVAVHDLRVKDNDLVIATHGRSFWILDNVTALREWKPEVKSADAYLFPTPPAIRWRYSGNFHEKGLGQNPPAAAMIEYWLKAKSSKDISIDILDSKGALVRTLSSVADPQEWPIDDPDEGSDEANEADLKNASGVQRGFWDFRYEGAKKVWRAKLDAGAPGDGPLASPGTYTVRLNADGKTYTRPLVVNPDPRLSMTAAQYDEQLKMSLAIRDDFTRLSEMIETLRSARTQIQARRELVKEDKGSADWVKSADATLGKLDSLENRLHNPKAEVVYDILAFKGGAQLYSRLGPLYSFVVESDGVPTQGMREVYATQKAELEALDKEWKALVATDLTALNKTAQPAIVLR